MAKYARICLNMPEFSKICFNAWLLILTFRKLQVLIWRKMRLFSWRHNLIFSIVTVSILFCCCFRLNIFTSKICRYLLRMRGSGGSESWYTYFSLLLLAAFVLKHNRDKKKHGKYWRQNLRCAYLMSNYYINVKTPFEIF